jgi:hypothetical protein
LVPIDPSYDALSFSFFHSPVLAFPARKSIHFGKRKIIKYVTAGMHDELIAKMTSRGLYHLLLTHWNAFTGKILLEVNPRSISDHELDLATIVAVARYSSLLFISLSDKFNGYEDMALRQDSIRRHFRR